MACQVLGTLESHGDPSLGLLSIKDNGFYVHREMTLTLRLAQSKQTDIVKIKIPPAHRLMTRNSCNKRLASLLENTSRSRRVRGNLPMTGRLGKPSRTLLPEQAVSHQHRHTNHCRQGRRKKLF